MDIRHRPTIVEARAGPGPTPTRLAFVDNLRVALTALVVAHHVALAYGNLGIWPNWQEPASELAALPLDVFVLLNQSFFMGFFFLLSGLFVPSSADRRGVAGFVRGRWRRLAVPLLGALVVVRPLYALPEHLEQPPAERGSFWEFFLTNWNIGPLWFLGVLLVFSLAYAAVRAATSAPRPARPAPPVRPAPAASPASTTASLPARFSESSAPPAPAAGSLADEERSRSRRVSGRPEMTTTALRTRSILGFVVVLGLVSYAWRTLVPVGTSMLGIPSAAHLPQYVALFVVGVVAYRRGWLHALPRRTGLLGLALIVASLAPMILLDGAATLLPDAGIPAADLAHLGFALWEAFFGIGAILVLTAVFRRHVTGGERFARFLGANAFAVYLLHAAVIVGIVALLRPLVLPPAAMFGVVLVLALAASWGVAALVRRLPGARSVL